MEIIGIIFSRYNCLSRFPAYNMIDYKLSSHFCSSILLTEHGERLPYRKKRCLREYQDAVSRLSEVDAAALTSANGALANAITEFIHKESRFTRFKSRKCGPVRRIIRRLK